MTKWTGIKLIKVAIRKADHAINRLGSNKKCYVCNKTFGHFLKFRNGTRGINEFRRQLNMIGSDVDNFGCMYCGSHDRERHLFMFFDKLEIWERMRGARILHFAPEKNLAYRICEQSPLEYVKADLYPSSDDIRKMDATAIGFEGNRFNLIIANHILEHIRDYTKALREFYRTLNSGGIAILQTPFSKLLNDNLEDDNIDTDELRSFFHGQEDHVRTFAERHLLKNIEEAGFDLDLKRHGEFFDERTAHYYGVNSKEYLMQARKPI